MNAIHLRSELAILAFASLQGLALFVLHRCVNDGVWTHFSPQSLLASYALVICVPTVIMLAWGVGDRYRLLKSVSVYALLVLVMAFYTGTQLTPDTLMLSTATWLPLIFTLVVISFIALPFIQAYACESLSLVANPLKNAWLNVSILILSWGFVVGVFAVLMLWAALFSVLEIEFFSDLFSDQAFLYPVTAFAQGIGILLVRRVSSVVISINLLIKSLVRLLLALLCLVFLLFLLTLLFSGLEPLWATGGSFLIMGLQLALLVFLGAAKPHAEINTKVDLGIHGLITTAFCLLPLATAISLYGLSIRIEQYGWTVLRFWAVTLWALLAVFSLGYAIKIIQKQSLWLDALQPFKVRAAWLVLVLGGFIHSPLLDFRHMTLTAQLQALERGATELENVDFQYVNDELGKPGQATLVRLEQKVLTTHPDIAAKIRAVLERKPLKSTKQHFVDSLRVLGGSRLSETETAALYQWTQDGPWQVREADHYWVLPKDVDGDDQQDWLVAASRYDSLSFWLVHQQQGQWRHHQMHVASPDTSVGERACCAADMMSAVIEAVDTGQVTLERPRWFQLKLGDIKLVVDESGK